MWSFPLSSIGDFTVAVPSISQEGHIFMMLSSKPDSFCFVAFDIIVSSFFISRTPVISNEKAVIRTPNGPDSSKGFKSRKPEAKS